MDTNFFIVIAQFLLLFLSEFDNVHPYRHKFKKPRLEPRKAKPPKNINRSYIVNDFHPQQIHISFGEKSTDIVVIWATRAIEPEMAVQYSYNTKITDKNRVVGEQVEFRTNNEKGAKYWHRAYLKDLKPGTKYWYRITSKKNGISSEIFHFNTPSTEFSHFQSYMILADMGLNTINLQNIVHESRNFQYTSVFHIGDIGYDLHSWKGGNGDKFLNNIQVMTSSVPYLVSPGDHEYKYDFSHFRHRFSMPTLSWPMKSEKLYYSFDIGPTHFISLNTEMLFHSFKKDNQLGWLQKDLTEVNGRANRPWVIVMGHRPLYSSCDKRRDCLEETPVVKKQLEDIFFKYGVDLYIGGHYHNYERSWPVYKEKIVAQHYKNPKAPIYITMGTLGQQYLKETVRKPSGLWSAKSLSEVKECFGVLDIINSTHLNWKVLAAANNAKVDQIWVIQHNRARFGDPQNYLENNGRNPSQELPPEPIIMVGKPDPHLLPILHIRRGIPYKDSGLIVVLITVCSFAFFICIFSRKLWKR